MTVLVAGLAAVALTHSGSGSTAGSVPAQHAETVAPSATTTASSTEPVRVGTCQPDEPRPGPPPTGTNTAVTALVLEDASPDVTLDRWDKRADSGPWAVVVHRQGGSLGRCGAVVTFPVVDSAGRRTVSVNGVAAHAEARKIIWPIGGGVARVRGDLSESALVKIAAATRIVKGRPVVRAPAGYAVVQQGPYRPAHIREARYSGAHLDAVLSGLVSTGVASVAGFEDQLYTQPLAGVGWVRGHPAVVTPVIGGNGALVWQPAPDQVAYVGYSGSQLTGPVLAAIQTLADHSRAVDDREWRDSRPMVIDQPNDLN